MKRLCIVMACGVMVGCGPHFPRPLTAGQFASYDSGAALAHYLSQEDASPSVCDPLSQGPHITHIDEEVARALTTGLENGRIQPELWRRCGEALLRGAAPEQARLLLDEMGRTYRKILRNSKLDTDLQKQAALLVLHNTFIERPVCQQASADLETRLLDDLQQALVKNRLGAFATRQGQDLLTIIEIEQGRFQGQAVSEAVLDQALRAGDEKLLGRFAARLPNPALRVQATRRIIRLHIAASPFAEVRANPVTVEDIVIKLGRYPVSTSLYPVVSSSLDLAHIPIRGVLARQHIWKQTITLLGYQGEKPGVSILPELSLRHALLIQLRGISLPVTLCGPAQALDPSPCIPAEEILLANPIAYLDRDGAFHFSEHLTAQQALTLAGVTNFKIPLSLGGSSLITLDWGLYFERPKDLIFTGSSSSATGPSLGVGIERHIPQRVVVTTSLEVGRYLAVVEMGDLANFHIISRGARGASGMQGARGYDGMNGSDGLNASCPSMPGQSGSSGGQGGQGGPGGNGGPGGMGGNIDVLVKCLGNCTDLQMLLPNVIQSQGGAGGRGGSGGAGGNGGQGGRGGMSTTCFVNGSNYSLSGGSMGSRGPDGPSGPNGPDGRPGSASQVNFSWQ